MTAFVILCVALYLAAIAVVVVTNAFEQKRTADLWQLDEDAETWSEPSRADVEWDMIRAAVEDTPIYSETAAYIAQHAAADLDREWADINRGGAA